MVEGEQSTGSRTEIRHSGSTHRRDSGAAAVRMHLFSLVLINIHLFKQTEAIRYHMAYVRRRVQAGTMVLVSRVCDMNEGICVTPDERSECT